MKSEKIDLLAAALTKAQSEFKPVPMNAENPFLHNRYADLGSTIQTAEPVLSKNGLVISQQVISEGDKVGVTTTLMHSSGQWIESTASLPIGDEKGKSLAQVAGSIITYLRRYAYAAIIGLYTDEDNDGTTKTTAKEPAKALPKMDLQFAASELNSEGVPYGQMETADLEKRELGLSKVKNPTEEQTRKLTAIRTVLASRKQ